MVTIRRATLADAALIAELIMDVQQLHADALPRIYKPVTDPALFMEDIEKRLLANPDGWVYIAEVDGEAVGCAYAARVHRPATPYTYAREYLMVDQISVKPAYQGRGCGQALMQAVMDLADADGIERVTLQVLEFNTVAIGFYKHLGFEMFNHTMAIDLAKV